MGRHKQLPTSDEIVHDYTVIFIANSLRDKSMVVPTKYIHQLSNALTGLHLLHKQSTEHCMPGYMEFIPLD